MPTFSSNRERRLWCWTAAAVLATYATLGLAGRLAGLLRDRALIDDAFGFGLLLVGATLVTQGWQVRPRGIEVGLVLGTLSVLLFLVLRMGITPDERTHLIEYSVVATFAYSALLERARQGRKVPNPALLAVLGTVLVGVLDEGIQAFLPERVFDPVDILFNALAATMAVAACIMLDWVRRRLGPTRGEANAHE